MHKGETLAGAQLDTGTKMFIKHCNSIKLKTLTISFFFLNSSDTECGCDGWSLIAIMDHKLTSKLEARLRSSRAETQRRLSPQ